MPEAGNDVIINGERYPLVLDKQSQTLQYQEGNPIDLQEGKPDIPVTSAYPIMTPGGMGETKRVARESVGHAHTVGMNATGYGLLRLFEKRTTVVPTNLPEDVPFFGFEEPLLGTSATTVGIASLTSGSKTATETTIIQKSLTSGASQTAPVTATLMRELNSSTPGLTHATTTWTPVANKVYLATVVSGGGSGSGSIPATLTGNGITWSSVAATPTGDLRQRVEVFQGTNASPSAGATTATFGSAVDQCKISIVELGNTASTAITQSNTDFSATAVNSFLVSPTAAATGAMFGAFAVSQVSDASFNLIPKAPPYTQISELQFTSSTPRTALHTAFSPTPDTRASLRFQSSETAYFAGIVIEIAPAGTGTSASTFTTAPIAPTANALVLLAVDSAVSGAAAPSSVTGGGMTTWTLEEGGAYASAGRQLNIYRALQASPGAAAPVIINFAAAQDSVRWSIVEFQNVVTSGTNGADACVQSVDATGSSTTPTVTLAAFGDATNNATYAAIGANLTTGVTSPTLDEMHEVQSGGVLQTAWQIGEDTSPDGVITSAPWGICAIEIAANVPASNYTTDSISPSANKLIVAAVFSNSAGVETPTASGNNLTWTMIDTDTTSTLRVTLFRAMSSTTPPAGAVTFNFGADQTAVRWSIVEFTGVDVTSSTQAVVQSWDDVGTSATYSTTTGTPFSDTGNATYGAFGVNSSTDPTKGSGFTEIHDVDAGSMTLFTEWRTGSDVSVDATGDNVAFVAVAIEIAAATSVAASAQYIYLGGGRYLTKVSKGGTAPNMTITQEHQTDFGPNAQFGRPARYGQTTAKWYLALGNNEEAQTLDSVSTGSGDTFSTVTGIRAQAFATQVQGANSSLLRAFDGNKVNTSTDGSTFGPASGFPVGNASEKITSMIESGSGVFVATDSNLHEFPSGGSGVSRKLTPFPVSDKDDDFGAGLAVPEGSGVAFYNHRGYYFWDGGALEQVDIDANELNQAIANVTFEPFRVIHTSMVIASRKWIYVAAQVTESSTTKTYLIAGRRHLESGRITWDCLDRFDGVMRLVPISGGLDSGKCMWFAFVGTSFGCWQLGPNGEPDPGRDSLGKGAASTTFQWYSPRDDFGFPHTLKQLVSTEVKTLNSGATCPLEIKILKDSGAAVSAGSTITSSGVHERYYGTDDSCYDLMTLLEVVTTSGYDPTATDLIIFSVINRAFLRPKQVQRVNCTIDTSRPLYSSESESQRNANDMLADLKTLERAAPTSLIDPNDNTKNLYITGVTATTKNVLESGPINYIIQVEGVVWRES